MIETLPWLKLYSLYDDEIYEKVDIAIQTLWDDSASAIRKGAD